MAKLQILNRQFASQYCTNSWTHVAFCSLIISLGWIDVGSAYGQSFLEKLESVVREKMNTPATVPQSPKTANGSKATDEELPAPKRSGQPNSGTMPLEASGGDSTDSIPSILERETPAVPAPNNADRSRPAPSSDPGLNAPASENAGVYLGMEVEEVVGGGIGVRVSSLTENSPAWKAGFKSGDLLQAVDGHAIADIDGMADRLKRIVPGKPTKFLVKRSGRNLELVAVLQSASVASRIAGQPAPSGTAGVPYLGITASELTPAFRTQFGLSAFSGAAVTNVAQDAPAYAAGIRPGDAIVEINGGPIGSSDDLVRWLVTAQIGQPVELMVYRGTQPSVVSFVLGGDPRNAPAVERPRSARAPQANNATRPNANLQLEVEQLRADLEQTQRQLLQTQQRLDEVLQQLEQNR